MSNPPATITNVMPTAMTCSIATSRVMLRTLATVGNASGSRIEKTMISAEQHAAHVERRRRHHPPPRRPAGRELGRGRRVEPGADDRGVGVDGRRRPDVDLAHDVLPWSDRRRGDDVEGAGHRADELLDGGVAPRYCGDPLAEAQHLDAVGDLEHLGHVVADQHHGDALVGDPADQLEHLAGLAHAERGGRLVHEDRPCWPTSPSGRSPRSASGRPTARRPAASRSLTSVPIERERLAGLLAHRLLVEHAELAEEARLEQLPAGEGVLGRAELGRQGEVLVDGLDAEVAGVGRRATS